MWDHPRPGMEPVSPALAGGFLTTGPPGKSNRHPSEHFICIHSFATRSNFYCKVSNEFTAEDNEARRKLSHMPRAQSLSGRVGIQTWMSLTRAYTLDHYPRLQAVSCSTLCNPMDCSPPGFFVHRDSPDKYTGFSCHALLQGDLPNPGIVISCIVG